MSWVFKKDSGAMDMPNLGDNVLIATWNDKVEAAECVEYGFETYWRFIEKEYVIAWMPMPVHPRPSWKKMD